VGATIHPAAGRVSPPAQARCFSTAITAHGIPDEVVTERGSAIKTVMEEQLPGSFHNTDQYANNTVERDHGRLKARLRPMRGLKTDHTARVVIAGHAFVQNIRRGQHQLGGEAEPRHGSLRHSTNSA
jgi:IS6 family transposase